MRCWKLCRAAQEGACISAPKKCRAASDNATASRMHTFPVQFSAIFLSDQPCKKTVRMPTASCCGPSAHGQAKKHAKRTASSSFLGLQANACMQSACYIMHWLPSALRPVECCIRTTLHRSALRLYTVLSVNRSGTGDDSNFTLLLLSLFLRFSDLVRCWLFQFGIEAIGFWPQAMPVASTLAELLNVSYHVLRRPFRTHFPSALQFTLGIQLTF